MKAKSSKGLNPVILMFGILCFAMILTFILPSGEFKHNGKLVIPGSYQVMEKPIQPANLISSSINKPLKNQASPVGMADMLQAIPEGISKQSGLIFMVLFIGGMIGVLNKTGTIEAALERTLNITRGNLYILVPLLMLIFSAGSTFMGLSASFLIMIPMIISLTSRMGYSPIFGLAIVAIGVKIGYLSSLTNPYALSVAQPLLNLPVYSGISMRLLTYVIMLPVGIGFILWKARYEKTMASVALPEFDNKKLSTRHTVLLIGLGLGIGFMVYASSAWEWSNSALSAYYIFLSIIFAIIAGLKAEEAVTAFIEGMKNLLLAGVLIGLATAVEIVLNTGKVLDTIVYYLVDLVGSNGPYVSAYSMLVSQLLIDVVIPSTSGHAAMTMPIMGPVGQLSGVTPQTNVYAFLLGNGLTNIVTPTSSALLIFLATAEVEWTHWVRFIWPLLIILSLISIGLLTLAVYIGY